MARKSNDNIDPSTYEDVTNTDPKTSAYMSSRKTPKPKVGDRVRFRNIDNTQGAGGTVTNQRQGFEFGDRYYNSSDVEWDDIGPGQATNENLFGPEGEEYKDVDFPEDEEGTRPFTDAERRYLPSPQELDHHIRTTSGGDPYETWAAKPHPDLPPQQKSADPADEAEMEDDERWGRIIPQNPRLRTDAEILKQPGPVRTQFHDMDYPDQPWSDRPHPDLPPKQKSVDPYYDEDVEYDERIDNFYDDPEMNVPVDNDRRWWTDAEIRNQDLNFQSHPPTEKSIPGDLNWLQEEGEEMEHPQLKMCKDCSDFLRKLSTERAFGDPHRQMAQQYYAKLNEMSGMKMDPPSSGDGTDGRQHDQMDGDIDAGYWEEFGNYMDDGPIELNPNWEVGQSDTKARKPKAPRELSREDLQALRDPDEGAQFIPDSEGSDDPHLHIDARRPTLNDPTIDRDLDAMYRTPTGKPKSPKAQERVTQQALRALRDPSDPTPKPKKARDSRAAAQARRVPPEALTPQALEGLKDPSPTKAYQSKASPREEGYVEGKRRMQDRIKDPDLNYEAVLEESAQYREENPHTDPNTGETTDYVNLERDTGFMRGSADVATHVRGDNYRTYHPYDAEESTGTYLDEGYEGLYPKSLEGASEDDDYTPLEDYGGMYRERSPGPVPASNTRPMTENERTAMVIRSHDAENQTVSEFPAADPRTTQRYVEIMANRDQRMRTPTANLGGRPVKKLAKKSLGDVLDEQNSQLQHLQKTLEALNSVL